LGLISIPPEQPEGPVPAHLLFGNDTFGKIAGQCKILGTAYKFLKYSN
jgi:hypothetical protein